MPPPYFGGPGAAGLAYEPLTAVPPTTKIRLVTYAFHSQCKGLRQPVVLVVVHREYQTRTWTDSILTRDYSAGTQRHDVKLHPDKPRSSCRNVCVNSLFNDAVVTKLSIIIVHVQNIQGLESSFSSIEGDLTPLARRIVALILGAA